MPLTAEEKIERQKECCKRYYANNIQKVKESIHANKYQLQPKKIMTDKSEIETEDDFFMDLN